MLAGSAIRQLQEAEIKYFLVHQNWRMQCVLDYGCGRAPYRSLIEEGGGEWNGWNRSQYPPHDAPDIGAADVLEDYWDVIVCTQVIQFIPNPAGLLHDFKFACGRLVMTYATNWPEVEGHDRFRYTKAGMEEMLKGWHITEHVKLGSVGFSTTEEMSLGYGVVASPR